MSAALTADAPHWLVFALIGLVLSLYGLCGLLALGSRLCRQPRCRRPGTNRQVAIGPVPTMSPVQAGEQREEVRS